MACVTISALVWVFSPVFPSAIKVLSYPITIMPPKRVYRLIEFTIRYKRAWTSAILTTKEVSCDALLNTVLETIDAIISAYRMLHFDL